LICNLKKNNWKQKLIQYYYKFDTLCCIENATTVLMCVKAVEIKAPYPPVPEVFPESPEFWNLKQTR
jgi:hypothetical protein